MKTRFDLLIVTSVRTRFSSFATAFKSGNTRAGSASLYFYPSKNIYKKFILLLAILVSTALSAAEKSHLKSITVDDNYPYNFLSGGRVQGIGYEVTKLLAERAGFQLDTEVVPWSRALLTAREQPNVLLFSIIRIPERENDFYWMGPIGQTEEWLYRLSSRNDFAIRNLDDVKPYVVGDVANNSVVPYLRNLGVKVDTAPDNTSNCRKFKYGRVDFVVINPEGVQAFLNLCELNHARIEKVLFLKSSDLYIALSKRSDPQLVAQLSEQFAKMVKDKSMEKIAAKWLNKSASTFK